MKPAGVHRAARLGLRARALAGLLAGCSAIGPLRFPASQPLGSTEAEVLARLGPPTGRYPLATGERLQYSNEPAGSAVYNLDLDADHHLVRVDQPLVRGRIEQDMVIDQTTAEQIRQLYGAPMRIEKVARFEGDVWTYQFLDLNEPFYLHLHLDPGGVLRRVVFMQVRNPSSGRRH